MNTVTKGLAEAPASSVVKGVAGKRAPLKTTGIGAKPAQLGSGTVAAVGTINHLKGPTAEEKRIHTLEKTSGRAYNVFMMDLVHFMGAGFIARMVGKVAGPKGNTAVRAVLSAPIEALRHTKINALHRLPSNYMDAVRGYAEAAGATEWAEAAGRRAVSLRAGSMKANASLKQAMAPVTTPVKETLGKGVASVENTAAAKGLSAKIQQFAEWRAKGASARHLKQLSKAEEALTKAPVPWYKKIANFVTGTKPAALDAHPQLATVSEHLSKARAAGSASAAAVHMRDAQAALETVSKGAEGELAKRIQLLTKPVRKSEIAASATQHLGSFKGEGLGGILKSIGRGVGKQSLLTGIVAVGATAAVSAIALKSSMESREGKEAYAGLVADIGNENAEFLAIVKQAYKEKTHARRVSSTISAASEAVNIPLMAMQGGGGGHMMLVQFGPMLTPLLVKDNPLLNAYTVLKKAEKGQIELSPEQKTELVLSLVAAQPSVNRNGKELNRLAKPIAEELVSRNMSTQAIVKLLADEGKFVPMAKEIADKREAAAQAVAAAAPEAGGLSAKEMHETNAAVAEAQAIANGHHQPHLHAPTAVVSGAQHHGRVSHEAHKALA